MRFQTSHCCDSGLAGVTGYKAEEDDAFWSEAWGRNKSKGPGIGMRNFCQR